ncbi:MAG: HEAT repeat domain-containing protein [Gemmatimonadota bacterium]|nr:HEAT repeat domain-containing protein [Gemmatimonadota bacterium]MDH3423455.1 HEAT repeat domain-containing protein [Gemmatimonadota bacterium]
MTRLAGAMTADLDDLVEGLGAPTGAERFNSYQALITMGTSALPAIRRGLRSPQWQVRRWSAMCLDQVADEDSLADLVPLLRDSHPGVRLWAVHSIACEHCKDDVSCPIDVVPLLIDRIRVDPSIRVRRMAVIMLGSEYEDPRAIPALEAVLGSESDTKIRRHAQAALERLRSAGLT